MIIKFKSPNMLTWFPKEDFRFEYKNPQDFYLPQWQTTDKMAISFFMYRLFNAGYYYMICYFSERVTWHMPHSIKMYAFAYYTYWSYVICSINSTMLLIGSLLRLLEEIDTDRENREEKITDVPVLFRTLNVFGSLSFDFTITTTCGFWTLVYFYQKQSFHLGSCILHLWNTVVLLIDFMIVRVPVSLAHGVYSILLTAIYVCFTYFYYLLGGKSFTGKHYLYKMLDYERPGLVCAGILAVLTYVVAARLLAFLLFKLKIRLFEKNFLEDPRQ